MSQPTSTNPFESTTTSETYAPPAGPPSGHSTSPLAAEFSHQAPSDNADVTAPTASVVTPPPPVTNVGSPIPAATSPTPSNQSTRAALSQSPPHAQSPPPQTQEREAVNDPRIIALRGMFPDYDDLILQSVLESAGGNQDRAIDTLLGMSDPDYRSEAPPHVENPAPQLTQEQLDEQFARQLVMQEQQQQNQQWIQAQTDAGRPPPPVNYAVRQGTQTWHPQPQSGQQQPQQDRPTEFQEQFNKIAESGKKTFGSIFSKVKAKIQEFETGRPTNAASTSNPGTQQQHQWTPEPQPVQQQAAYYDPNPASRPAVSPPMPTPGVTPPPTQSVQGYDVSSSPPPNSSIQQQLQRQPSPSPAVVPPPSTTLDAAKFGLLPKRPVSLVRPDSGGAAGSSTTPARQHHDDDSDDGLEYAENPFETDNSAAAAPKK